MPKYVLDTHACVFMLVAPQKLGRAARSALDAMDGGRAEALIPAAALAEICLLRELNRLRLGLPEMKTAMDLKPALRFLALDMTQLDVFASLTSIRDPFDRLIVSATRVAGAKLITKDATLAESGLVQTIWA